MTSNNSAQGKAAEPKHGAGRNRKLSADIHHIEKGRLRNGNLRRITGKDTKKGPYYKATMQTRARTSSPKGGWLMAGAHYRRRRRDENSTCQ